MKIHLFKLAIVFSKKVKNKLQQVVAPKGLDISSPTTVVMPNHVGFAQLFSQGTKSVAEALWDKINYQLTQLAQVKTRPEESVMGQKSLTDIRKLSSSHYIHFGLKPGPRI